MKPVVLMSYPIRNSSATNGIVLDPFLGSGSTLIACQETNRVCRGIELDPKFVDVIVKRFWLHEKDTGKDLRDEIKVIREGQELTLSEVCQTLDEEES